MTKTTINNGVNPRIYSQVSPKMLHWMDKQRKKTGVTRSVFIASCIKEILKQNPQYVCENSWDVIS